MFEEIMKILPADESIKRWFISHYSTRPKQDWSEEDEKILQSLLRDYEYAIQSSGSVWGKDFEKKYFWLKSLRPSWKPSEEQMAVLLSAEVLMIAGDYPESARILAELYIELKRL